MFANTYFVWKLRYDDPPAGGEPQSGGSEKKFSQEDVNAMLADNKRKLQTANKELTDKLEALQVEHKGNKSLVDQLQEQIDGINNKTKSEVTLAKEETEKVKKKHAEEVKALTEDRDKYSKMFNQHLIGTQITQAAIEGEAFSPMQINSLLSSKAKVSAKEDGTFAVEIEYTEMKDGSPQTLILSPSDTIKRMKETPDLYGNLFKSGVKSGTGGGNVGGGNLSLKEIASDPVKYRAYREQQRAGRK
jgi:hypothetical protein